MMIPILDKYVWYYDSSCCVCGLVLNTYNIMGNYMVYPARWNIWGGGIGSFFSDIFSVHYWYILQNFSNIAFGNNFDFSKIYQYFIWQYFQISTNNHLAISVIMVETTNISHTSTPLMLRVEKRGTILYTQNIPLGKCLVLNLSCDRLICDTLQEPTNEPSSKLPYSSSLQIWKIFILRFKL